LLHAQLALRDAIERLGATPVAVKGKRHIGSAERRVDYHLSHMSRFGVRRAEELPPSRYVEEEVAHLESRSHRTPDRRERSSRGPLRLEQDASVSAPRPRANGKATDRGHA